MENTSLVERLERVERDNQRLKLVVGALLLVLAAVPLIGAVMPEQLPEVIQAREFRLIDENFETRAVMSHLGIIYRDENYRLRAIMDSEGFSYHDENGNGIWKAPP